MARIGKFNYTLENLKTPQNSMLQDNFPSLLISDVLNNVSFLKLYHLAFLLRFSDFYHKLLLFLNLIKNKIRKPILHLPIHSSRPIIMFVMQTLLSLILYPAFLPWFRRVFLNGMVSIILKNCWKKHVVHE